MCLFVVQISNTFVQETEEFKVLDGGNSKIFGMFTPKLGEDEPILTSIFFKGVVQPPTRVGGNSQKVSRCCQNN